MKQILLAMIIIGLLTSQGYCQNIQQLLGQTAQAYPESEVSKSSLIGGFSVWGLMGGMLFGTIGFVAFIYGKKNSEFKPMILGILLMGYPYFVRGSIALYLTGIVLTTVLFVFRE